MPLRLLPLLLSLLICTACAQRGTPDPAPLAAGGEIAGAPVPQGVDPQLWRTLTRELARVVAERAASGKAPSTAAQGRGSEVRDLIINPDLNPSALCVWTYRCQGDYDLNGEVNISDLTPIAVHYGATSTGDNWQLHQFADGDGNGEVGISDISPLGQNLGARVLGYAIQEKAPADAQFTTVDFSLHAPGDPTSGEYPVEIEQLGAPVIGNSYRVVPSATTEEPYELGLPGIAVVYTGNGFQPQPWNQYGGNPQRTFKSKFLGPTGPGNPWTLDLQGITFEEGGPVADDSGVVYCTSSVVDLAVYPDLSASSGSVWAINRDGSVRWRFQVDAAIPLQPVLLYDRTVVVETYKHELIGLYPDGKLMWRQQLSANSQDDWWHLTVDDALNMYAIDGGLNLRRLHPDGSIQDTYPIPPAASPETGVAPVLAKTWLWVPGDATNNVYRYNLADCTLAGQVIFNDHYEDGMLYNTALDKLWVGVNGLYQMQGHPVGGGLMTNYSSIYRIWNTPALSSLDEVIAGEIVDPLSPQAPYTGRLVGINDTGSVEWDRPLELIPVGSMACDKVGKIYAGAHPDIDEGTEGRFYCIDAQHDVAFSVPFNGSPHGITIAAEQYAVGICSQIVGEQVATYLIGIDSE